MGCVASDGKEYCMLEAGIADDSGAVKTAVPSIDCAIYAESVRLTLD